MSTARPLTCEANSLAWHRKYWHPWGTTIGFHDEAHVRINGRLFVLKRFWKGDHIKFYVSQGFSARSRYGYEPCIRFSRLNEVLAFLTERSLLPKDTPTYIENPPPCSQRPGLIYMPSNDGAG
jgi:hypothetical protein